jgi:hypothetical protein
MKKSFGPPVILRPLLICGRSVSQLQFTLLGIVYKRGLVSRVWSFQSSHSCTTLEGLRFVHNKVSFCLLKEVVVVWSIPCHHSFSCKSGWRLDWELMNLVDSGGGYAWEGKLPGWEFFVWSLCTVTSGMQIQSSWMFSIIVPKCHTMMLILVALWTSHPCSKFRQSRHSFKT